MGERVVRDAQEVLVLGSNFGGLTAALKVKHELHGDVDVRWSPPRQFLFTPSLIWLPFGTRTRRTSPSRWRKPWRTAGSTSSRRRRIRDRPGGQAECATGDGKVARV